MNKLYSDDKSLFATFGKEKNGTHSVTIRKAEHRPGYPSYAFRMARGFQTRHGAKAWAAAYMNSHDEVPA